MAHQTESLEIVIKPPLPFLRECASIVSHWDFHLEKNVREIIDAYINFQSVRHVMSPHIFFIFMYNVTSVDSPLTLTRLTTHLSTRTLHSPGSELCLFLFSSRLQVASSTSFVE